MAIVPANRPLSARSAPPAAGTAPITGPSECPISAHQLPSKAGSTRLARVICSYPSAHRSKASSKSHFTPPFALPSNSISVCSLMLRPRLSATKDIPPWPIAEEIPAGLLDPHKIVCHHRPEPDGVPMLMDLDAGDDLPGLIDQGVQIGITADVQPLDPLEGSVKVVMAVSLKTFG